MAYRVFQADTNAAFQGLVRSVKKRKDEFHNNMKSIDRRDLDKLPGSTYRVSQKVDGMFVGLWCDGSKCFVVEPNGTMREGLPLTDECVSHGMAFGLVYGELYFSPCEALPSKRERIHSLLSVLAGKDIDLLDRVAFAPYSEYLTKLMLQYSQHESDGYFFPTHMSQKCIEVELAKGDISHYLEISLKRGEEGLVLRKGESYYKVKDTMDIDCVVIGYTVQEGGTSVKDLIVGLYREDSGIHVLGAVGSGITNWLRKSLYDEFVMHGDKTRSLVHNGVKVFMVHPSVCVKIECTDLITHSQDGTVKVKPVITDYPGYQPTMPMPSMMFPRFICVREGKDLSECGMEQVTGYVHVEQSDVDYRDNLPEASEVIKSDSYVKVIKGERLVRKVALLATNKGGENWTDYVVYSIDYSPNRADAVKRVVQPYNSDDSAISAYTAIADKIAVVKGWTLERSV
jgi:hypothetical protein